MFDINTLKENYWDFRRSAQMLSDALLRADRTFQAVVFKDHLSSRVSGMAPVKNQTRARATAAASWLVRAQDATPDGGVSYGYFPLADARGWEASYPETTGYIMTSLIAYAHACAPQDERAALIERARRMAYWEAEVQMPSGAVQGGKVCSADDQSPVAFNTGMVLDGYVSVLSEGADPEIETAARKAADFLVGDLAEDGLFRSNGPFVNAGAIKIYNVLCAWALYRLGRLIGEEKYCDAALRSVDGALAFMTDDGWIRENCLTNPLRPLTHTIGYALQGILEVGILDGRQEYIDAARKGFDPVMSTMEPNGFLSGRIDRNWQPAARWSCLTGSAQLAIVGFRLGEICGVREYTGAANLLVDWVKACQRIETGNPGIDGAIAGSFPILGAYMRGGYPNWATKYLLDALMLQMKHDR